MFRVTGDRGLSRRSFVQAGRPIYPVEHGEPIRERWGRGFLWGQVSEPVRPSLSGRFGDLPPPL